MPATSATYHWIRTPFPTVFACSPERAIGVTTSALTRASITSGFPLVARRFRGVDHELTELELVRSIALKRPAGGKQIVRITVRGQCPDCRPCRCDIVVHSATSDLHQVERISTTPDLIH